MYKWNVWLFSARICFNFVSRLCVSLVFYSLLFSYGDIDDGDVRLYLRSIVNMFCRFNFNFSFTIDVTNEKLVKSWIVRVVFFSWNISFFSPWHLKQQTNLPTTSFNVLYLQVILFLRCHHKKKKTVLFWSMVVHDNNTCVRREMKRKCSWITKLWMNQRKKKMLHWWMWRKQKFFT